MGKKLSKSARTILLITVFFSLSVTFSFFSQYPSDKISLIHQKQILDYMVFIDQQSNMLIWDEVCKEENCQSMLERAMILDDLSTNLNHRFNKRWIEIKNFQRLGKVFDIFSIIFLIGGMCLFFSAIKNS